MPVFLNILAVLVAIIGLFGAFGTWPEGTSAPATTYALPLAIGLNAAILAGALAGLATLIDHVAGIRYQIQAATRSVAASEIAPSGNGTTAAESGEVGQDAPKGFRADGRMQVLDRYRVRQLSDGKWRIEHLDGTPHEAFDRTFRTLGAAKRAAGRVV